MVKSIENFLIDEDRQLISDYIKEVNRRLVTVVRGGGMPDPPIKEPLKKLLQKKRREWENALKVPLPGMRGKSTTYWKQIMDGKIDCAIKDFLDTFEDMLKSEQLKVEHEDMLCDLEKGIDEERFRVCPPCPAEG